MRSSLYIGATGMKALSEGMHVTTNNLANVSTIGFKSQMALYSDLIYEGQANSGEWNNSQENSRVAVGQHGMGVRVDEIATNFTQGAFESTNSMTDLAINGNGYFLVSDASGASFYTRAGDFNVDTSGVMRNPTGHALMGYSLISSATNGQQGSATSSDFSSNRRKDPLESFQTEQLEPVEIDKFKNISASATSKISITDTNVVPSSNVSENATDPWFSMLNAYNALDQSALNTEQFSNSQSLSIYDADGKAHEVTIYYDGAPSENPYSAVEFLVAEDLDSADSSGAGLLMSGVLQFDAQGQLAGLSAYTPTTSASKNLNDWTAATLSQDGLPQFTLNGQKVAMDFGIHAQGGSLQGATRASDVGTNQSSLASLQNPLTSATAVTGYSSSPFMSSYAQNGYTDGVLSSYTIDNDGTVYGNFSNGQTIGLWQIPVARFTSDDGLIRTGDNLFAASSEAGTMALGKPGTENYGQISSYYIEQSNVDTSREMVNMIITQRGFQSNSKVVTTSDEMLRTAINLKQR